MPIGVVMKRTDSKLARMDTEGDAAVGGNNHGIGSRLKAERAGLEYVPACADLRKGKAPGLCYGVWCAAVETNCSGTPPWDDYYADNVSWCDGKRGGWWHGGRPLPSTRERDQSSRGVNARRKGRHRDVADRRGHKSSREWQVNFHTLTASKRATT
jgi:hypothetical protein